MGGSTVVTFYSHYLVLVIAVSEMFICSKIAAKSFGDGSQDIFKDTESNLGPVADL